MIYEWKPSARISASASVAGAVCERLENEGRLTAKDLLDDSRPTDAPLHSAFEWNDGVAAEKYRENQARHLISCLVVKPETDVESPAPVRAFFNIRSTGSQYETLNTIMKSPDKHQELLRQAFNDFHTFQQKYSTLCELNEVFSAMNKAEQDAK